MEKVTTTAALFLVLSLVLPAFSTPVVRATEDTWTKKAPMQQARGRLGVAVVNGKIYAIGGDEGYYFGSAPNNHVYLGRQQFVCTNEEYDPTSNKWTFKESMPTPRYHFGIAVYQNKIYCIGGYTSGGETGVNEAYDPETDTWETKAPMPTPRLRLDASVVDDKIYLIGGHTVDDYSVLNVSEAYDPLTDSWTTQTVSPPYRLRTEASVVVDNRIYFWGTTSTPLPPYVEDFIQIYDPESDSWSVEGPTPVYTSGAAVATTTGVFAPKKLHILEQDSHQIYDPTNDSWTVGVPMQTPRSYAGIAVINDTLYVVGGVNLPLDNALIGEISASAANEQYTPLGYIPEFPSWIILPLFLMTALFAVALKRRICYRSAT